MLFLGFMSRFCAASVLPLLWHYILAPLSDCLWGLDCMSDGYGHFVLHGKRVLGGTEIAAASSGS